MSNPLGNMFNQPAQPKHSGQEPQATQAPSESRPRPIANADMQFEERMVDALSPEELTKTLNATFGKGDRPELIISDLASFVKDREKQAINSGLRRGVRIFRVFGDKRVLLRQTKTLPAMAEFVMKRKLFKGFAAEGDDMNVVLIDGYVWEYWYHK